MPIDKVFQNIANSPIYTKAAKSVSKAAVSLGEKYEKTRIKDVFEKYLEPKSANNKFLTLAGLMVFCVIFPRVATALKRNPDNKEATNDEIREILFRDIQSVVVILFLLKTLNALIASFLSAKKGLPLTSKPYQKMFDSSLTTFGQKMKDFAAHPFKKLKIAGKNVLDTIHPTEGVRAKVNNEYSVEYAKYEWKDLPKFFNRIETAGGDKEKIFNKILDGTIEYYEDILKGSNKKGKTFGIESLAKVGISSEGKEAQTFAEAQLNVQQTIEKLKALKNKNLEEILTTQDKALQSAFSEYFNNPANSLVQNGKGTNAWLRLAALGMEASYLGFGIPALNQKFLEKKYLSEEDRKTEKANETEKTGASLINKNIKAHEIKLYHNFIK